MTMLSSATLFGFVLVFASVLFWFFVWLRYVLLNCDQAEIFEKISYQMLPLLSEEVASQSQRVKIIALLAMAE